MKYLIGSVLTLLGLALGIAAGAYAGAFSFAADEPHPEWLSGLIGGMRERFVARRATGIEVPPLEDPGLLRTGARHYAAMCTGCHLAPGMADTELRAGLYPRPPDLSDDATPAGEAAARRQFWIIKHGIKASGMPAWGTTHDDGSVWALVALVQRLPRISKDEYEALAGKPAQGHEHHDHSHREHR